jgi:hypothetical protein
MTIRSKGISGVKVLAALSAGMGLLAAAGAASAQDSTWGSGGPGTRTGIYLEAGPSYMNFKGDDGIEADTWGATARAGWQILPMLSIEADATFGIDDGDFSYRTSEGDLSIDDNSDGDVADILSAPGSFGLNYMFGAYGRLSMPMPTSTAPLRRQAAPASRSEIPKTALLMARVRPGTSTTTAPSAPITPIPTSIWRKSTRSA